jgi:glycosyltransferase involved in cell wall biosynthesis
VHSINDFYDELLFKALKSLENQTFKDFDTVIVLDDCWDKTKEKILNFNLNLKINFIDKKNKSGLADAKNIGLSNINTDLVAFLDGDDLYEKDKLEKQISFFIENEVDFLGTQTWNINSLDEDNIFESCFKIGENETDEQIKSKLNFENCLTHGSMMIKMSSLKELGFYNNVTGMEDWDLWKRAVNYGFKFYQIQERLYILRLGTSVPR